MPDPTPAEVETAREIAEESCSFHYAGPDTRGCMSCMGLKGRIARALATARVQERARCVRIVEQFHTVHEGIGSLKAPVALLISEIAAALG